MTRNCLGEISASLLAFCAGLAPVVDTRWTRRACRGSDGAEWRLGRRSRCRALRSGPAAEQALPPSEERGDARTCVPVDATRECPALTNHPWQSEGFLHSSPKSAGRAEASAHEQVDGGVKSIQSASLLRGLSRRRGRGQGLPGDTGRIGHTRRHRSSASLYSRQQRGQNRAKGATTRRKHRT